MSQEVTTMKHHILAIGVSKHQNLSEINLSFAAKDATDFYELFTTNVGDFGYKKLLTDSEATLAQIRSALGTELQSQLKAGDVFFFYYSGHGATAETDDPNTLAHYLLPFDATRDIASSCISVKDLQEVFGKLPTQAQFVYIDSCFSGSAAHSKGYNHPRKKDDKSVKTFANTVTGKGSVIFTACKDDEEALEDPPNENSLFTHFLLTEMQRDSKDGRFSITDIFTPVMNGVIQRARDFFHHTQTPTQQSHLEGPITLPTFRNPIKILPQTMETPKNPELARASFPVPIITLSDKDQEKTLNETIQYVIERPPKDAHVNQLLFQQYCSRLIKVLRTEWDKIFTESQTLAAIPNGVAKIEAQSFQIVLLGAVISVFGTKQQMQVYAESMIKILGFGQGKSGLVAATTIPEIVIANIVYTIGVLCIAKGDLMPLRTLLDTQIWDSSGRDIPPYSLAQEPYYHYCDALGGESTKVNDHIREVLASQGWLTELLPDLETDIKDLQMQVNYLLVLLSVKDGSDLWPDFGRFYPEHILPFVQRIKYDEAFEKKVADFLGIKPSQVRQFMMDSLPKLRGQLRRGFDWDSFREVHLLTEEERRGKERARQAQQITRSLPT